MNILLLLIPLSVALLLVVGVALFWAVKSGQFEVRDDEARSILKDDDNP
ncbi:cbb3-type cytochrome oxidase assembly protein CcoS [Limnobacter humi]|uniref:Cbb3-type cytochrome oxidase assembly protein CcoS n=1 Tax=Limnobacter humi TaxID=1778671 RepID=A0ABT1WDH8_9BURK|nr:cbb3-type cytochrome oxidase assembly protein CcoS [Limnobacter humi]MCQ8895575.1 cbb3-type cytochrome oxidase assembly protein CcoS [Limnobacter humi]